MCWLVAVCTLVTNHLPLFLAYVSRCQLSISPQHMVRVMTLWKAFCSCSLMGSRCWQRPVHGELWQHWLHMLRHLGVPCLSGCGCREGEGYSIGTENYLCDPWFVTGKPVNNWFPPPPAFLFFSILVSKNPKPERGCFWLQVGLCVWIYAVLQTLT